MMNTAGIRTTLQAWHEQLVPAQTGLGWTPYLWLVYLGFLAMPFVFGNPDPPAGWVTGLSVIVFVPLYFLGFRCQGRAMMAVIVALTLLGIAVAPWNFGASVYFIFAASFAAFSGPPRIAIRNIGLVILAAAIETLLVGLGPMFAIIVTIVSIMVGVTNIFWRQMQIKNSELRASRDEIQRLAATAERERIARDLHDLLGHTLSVITLKAELAGRLVQSHPDRAERELEEIERVSRTALADVRQVVAGYRASTVRGELAAARSALASAGVVLYADVPEAFALSAEYENVLGLVLREAVTNVVRHARAASCRIRLEQSATTTRLVVADDGVGGEPRPGGGIGGMRERLEGVGGRILIGPGRRGIELSAEIPVGRGESDLPVQTNPSLAR